MKTSLHHRWRFFESVPSPPFEGYVENEPLIVSCGIGTDSIAMLIGLYWLQVIPSAVVFSDPGNEHQRTYAYIQVLEYILELMGFPPLTIVKYEVQDPWYYHYKSIAGNCIANRTLPSLAFGHKKCSLKWKGEIIDRWVASNFPESKPMRAIGYDSAPKDMRRFSKVSGRAGFVYPLISWGWTRSTCIEVIKAVGLPLPLKSSCTFCPSMKPHELDELDTRTLMLICIMEANAAVNLKSINGLWRTKRMTDYIVDNNLLPNQVVMKIWLDWDRDFRFYRKFPSFKHIELMVDYYIDCLIDGRDMDLAVTVEHYRSQHSQYRDG